MKRKFIPISPLYASPFKYPSPHHSANIKNKNKGLQAQQELSFNKKRDCSTPIQHKSNSNQQQISSNKNSLIISEKNMEVSPQQRHISVTLKKGYKNDDTTKQIISQIHKILTFNQQPSTLNKNNSELLIQIKQKAESLIQQNVANINLIKQLKKKIIFEQEQSQIISLLKTDRSGRKSEQFQVQFDRQRFMLENKTERQENQTICSIDSKIIFLTEKNEYLQKQLQNKICKLNVMHKEKQEKVCILEDKLCNANNMIEKEISQYKNTINSQKNMMNIMQEQILKLNEKCQQLNKKTNDKKNNIILQNMNESQQLAKNTVEDIKNNYEKLINLKNASHSKQLQRVMTELQSIKSKINEGDNLHTLCCTFCQNQSENQNLPCSNCQQVQKQKKYLEQQLLTVQKQMEILKQNSLKKEESDRIVLKPKKQDQNICQIEGNQNKGKNKKGKKFEKRKKSILDYSQKSILIKCQQTETINLDLEESEFGKVNTQSSQLFLSAQNLILSRIDCYEQQIKDKLCKRQIN